MLPGGGSKLYEIPEFLQDLVYHLSAEQKTLAAAALVEEKLSDFYDDAVVKNTAINASERGLEDVSLLAMWYFIGVTQPVTVGQLRSFLRRFIGLYTSLSLPAGGGVPRLNSGKGRLVLRDEDLERVKFQALDVPRPFSTGGTRVRANLGFTLNGKEYSPKDGEARREIFWGPYEEASDDVYYGPREDRFDALLVLAHEKAKADGVQYPIDVVVAAKGEVMSSELISNVNGFIRDKGRDGIEQYLRETWEVVDVEA